MNPFRRWITWVAILIFLVPACVGFVKKFAELVYLVDDPEGSFALIPVMNYLLASLGFFMLLGWAAMQGMFRNIEQPKYEMLETEKQLDLIEEREHEEIQERERQEHEQPWTAGL